MVKFKAYERECNLIEMVRDIKQNGRITKHDNKKILGQNLNYVKRLIAKKKIKARELYEKEQKH